MIYIHTPTYTLAFINRQVHTRTRLPLYWHSHMPHTYIKTRVHTVMYIHIYTKIAMHLHAYNYVHTHTFAHVCTLMHSYIRRSTCAHVHSYILCMHLCIITQVHAPLDFIHIHMLTFYLYKTRLRKVVWNYVMQYINILFLE